MTIEGSEEDLKQKEEKHYFIESTYMILCYENLKTALKRLRYRLHTLAITRNIELGLDPIVLKRLEQSLYGIMNKTVDNYIFTTKNANEIAQKIRQLKMSKHGGSDGFTINNFFNNSAMSIYIKNRKQFISKLSRTMLDNYNSLVKAVQQSILIEEFHETTFRIEITIWDFKAILQQKYYDLLDQLESFIVELAEYYKPQQKALTKEHSKFVNRFTKPSEDLMISWLKIRNLEEQNAKWMKILEPNVIDNLFQKAKKRTKKKKLIQ